MSLLLLFNNNMTLAPRAPTLTLGSIIIPNQSTKEGVLIKSCGDLWFAFANKFKDDWSGAMQLSPREWEEMIAGAFDKANYSVTLTPRSGDHGRDVIAVKPGVGCVRILGSVKAYKPGHLVTKEEVHALMGVVDLDANASKGMIMTTSDFAPKLLDDENLARAVPNRMELMNGKQLQSWLKTLTEEKD